MVSSLPVWLKNQLHHDDLSAIAAAVRNAEVKTGAEIVPIIVRRSAGYRVNFGAAPYLLPFVALFLVHFDLVPGDLWLIMTAALLTSALALLLFGRTSTALRLATPEHELDDLTLKRAQLEFFLAGLNHTAGGTGILLFLSLDERIAIVLADRGINEKLPTNTWDGVRDLIINGAKKKRLADGLVAAITRCGELAQPHFPPAAHNVNELKDRLIIKE